jgi:hypothetical protein
LAFSLSLLFLSPPFAITLAWLVHAESLAILAVAFTFSVVVELIADLDRPQEGVLKVSQHALLDLQRSMHMPTL